MKPLDLRWLLLVVVCVLACRAEEKKPVTILPPSLWTQIEAATGNMNLDGTLRLSFPMGSSAALKQLGLRFELEHRIEADAINRAHSVWRIKGLQNCLAPSGRDHLLWQPPVGAPVKFERARIGRALAEAGPAQWLIRESAPGEYEIRSLDGRAWRYRQGVLVSAEHPAFGQLRLSTQGAWITRIELADAPTSEPPFLQARYDDSGRLVSLQVGVERPQQLIWSGEGQLTAWQRADGSEVKFSYRDSLLSQLAEPGKPPRQLTWGENPGYGRGDSRWAATVHLASDGVDTYSYALTSRGFMMMRRENNSGRETLTIFNPLRRRLEQRTDGETLVVTFRGGIEDRGALERIATGKGEMLEEYRYSEKGQLLAVKRKGEPERILSYDESGRLMDLGEVGVP